MPSTTTRQPASTRVLLLHASVGTGHASAAQALAAAFARQPGVEARVEDSLDYANKLFRQAYTQSFLKLSVQAPLLLKLFYENANSTEPEWIVSSNRLRSLVERLGVARLERMVHRFAPDAIVCTHFLPAELLLRLKRNGELHQPIYTVVTDHVAHSMWITAGVDGYFVASELPRDLMASRGVPPERIHVTGIPVDLESAKPKEMAAMRERHGLPLSDPVITLFGGGIAVERVQRMVAGMLAIEQPGTLVVVGGRNEELAGALADFADGPQMRLRRLGQIDYVDDLVAASDLVITKAGGLITSEVLARGTPLIIIDPIPGQEEWNADYVVSCGAGIQLRMPESVPQTVQNVLAEPGRLAALRLRAQNAGRSRAALDIAERVLHELHAQPDVIELAGQPALAAALM
jgi:processive 1,2-diacylglycerol beta-glucosyltransferase